MLDSLVRVSRRVVEKHFVRVARAYDRNQASRIDLASLLPHPQASLTGTQVQVPTAPLLPNFSFSAISGTISLSFQSAFHLSLTVLVRYWSPIHI
jgi:hypothetical protein